MYSATLHADRTARARVNLVRVTNKPKDSDERYYDHKEAEYIEDAFIRWVEDCIGAFEEESEELKEERALKLQQSTIDELLESYNYEKDALRESFQAIGKLPYTTIEVLGLSKENILAVIRKNIKELNTKYWRLTIDKVEAIKCRLTKTTCDRIYNAIREFEKLDFNSGNIYSIVIWIINNCNISIPQQVCDVFDKLTEPDYEVYGVLQEFGLADNEIAFTMRYYKNGNLHLKINEKIMRRFNIEVGKVRHWLNCLRDIQAEFETSEEEAVRLWNTNGIGLIGNSDIKLLEAKNENE